MLFAAKRDARTAIATAAALATVAVAARSALGLSWDLRPGATVAVAILAGLAVVVAADGAVHLVLWRLLGGRYLSAYGALVGHFEGQSRVAIAAGGLLAGAEELLFRGVLLGALAGLVPVALAVSLSALAFGAAHLLPDRRLRPFALWAVWEGIALGAIYVLAGSLLVPVSVHAAHDVLGFALFARQRRAG